MLTDLPAEVLGVIAENLSLSTIGKLTQSCSKSCYIINHINWDRYYRNVVDPMTLPAYDDVNIDLNFMKTHGCYLINHYTLEAVLRWFKFYPHILHIISLLKENEISTVTFDGDKWKRVVHIGGPATFEQCYGNTFISRTKTYYLYSYEGSQYSNDPISSVLMVELSSSHSFNHIHYEATNKSYYI